MIYEALRSLLFRLDPESAHELALAQMERLQRIPIVMTAAERFFRASTCRAPVEKWGLTFRNPIGIAAGFDKNAEMVPFLRAIGFGFVEVGTVTLRPQPGNPKPRLFRIPADKALINRLGFNNEGAHAVARRLEALPRAEGQPLFVNVGKNRDVPLDEAAQAYRRAYAVVAPFADGAVINVSSPNTPGLRDLQSPEHIREIVREVKEERARLRFAAPGTHPVLVKIAPDLDESQLASLVRVCLEEADGIIATNTTLSREGLTRPSAEAGGLSGRPLFGKSTAILRQVRALAGPGYPVVGVGGVFTAEDAAAKLAAGADLVQLYTGFIYEGPFVVRKIVRQFQ